MADTETLTLLAEIVDGLGALGEKTKGEPLRAADWNGLIDGVTRLARLAAARERTLRDSLSSSFAAADHVHLGQVTAAWLAPETAALLNGAAQGAQAAARLDALGRQLASATAQITALASQVTALRTAIDQLRDGTSEANRRAGNAEQKLNGLVDLDRRVTVIDRRFTSLADDVKATLDFRDTLRDADGQPLDLKAMAGRLTAVEEIRDALKAADGNVIRAREIESRIIALERDRLDPTTLDARLTERLRDPAVLQAAEEAIGTRLNAQIDGRITAIETAAKGLTDTLAATRTEQAADRDRIGQIDGRTAATAARIDALAALPGQVSGQTTRVTAIEAQLRQQDAALAALPELRSRVGAVEQTLTTSRMTERLDALDRGVADAGRRLGIAEAGVAAAQATTARVTAVEQGLSGVRAAADRAEIAARSVTALAQRLDVQEARLNDLKPLRDRLTVVEQDRDVLRGQVSAINTRLASTPDNTRMTEITGRLTTLETRSADTTRRVGELDTRFTEQSRATDVTVAAPASRRQLRPGV